MQRKIELHKCKCGYETLNHKSFSNHIRYGCKSLKFIEDKCLYCGNNLPKRKPSEKGLYCNRFCYFNHRKQLSLKPNLKTGESRTRLYSIWLGMKRRCSKPNCKDFKNYGGRGIVIHKDWLNNFMTFKEWAYKNGYKDYLTIERIDVNGNYEPSNCKWILMNEQSKNRRNVKIRI